MDGRRDLSGGCFCFPFQTMCVAHAEMYRMKPLGGETFHPGSSLIDDQGTA